MMLNESWYTILSKNQLSTNAHTHAWLFRSDLEQWHRDRVGKKQINSVDRPRNCSKVVITGKDNVILLNFDRQATYLK